MSFRENINIERWYKFCFNEQIGHIGSEIGRAKVWENRKDFKERNNSLERALELIEITEEDPRHFDRQKELSFLRENLMKKLNNVNECSVSLSELDQYCLEFALITAQNK